MYNVTLNCSSNRNIQYPKNVRKNNLSFRSKVSNPMLEALGGDAFLKLAPQEQKSILKDISSMFGLSFTALAAALGLSFKQQEAKYIEYPVQLPKDSVMCMPDGKKLNLSECLRNGNECNAYMPAYTEKYMKIDDYSVKINGHLKDADSYKGKYMAEPNSYMEGSTKLICFDDLPEEQEFTLIHNVPTKFIDIPKGSEIISGGKSIIISENSVIIYNVDMPNKFNIFPNNTFVENFRPTDSPKSLAAFENILENKSESGVKKVVKTHITKNGTEFNVTDNYVYSQPNLGISKVWYDNGIRCENVKMDDIELESVVEQYNKCLELNQDIKNYDCSFSIEMPMKRVRIELHDRNMKPWENDCVFSTQGTIDKDENIAFDMDAIKSFNK